MSLEARHDQHANRHRDLDDRGEIVEMVNRFYRDVAQDQVLHPWFEDVAHPDWQAHQVILADYWEGSLLSGDHQSADDLIDAHVWLNRQLPFTPAVFDRWLELFFETIDTGWQGPNATAAKRRGLGLAWAMCHRLVGDDAWRPHDDPRFQIRSM